jgi:ElaB/YqjD/DUF883 family membrane-anchored ribosome-binding protein
MAERTNVTSLGALDHTQERTADSIRQDIAAKRESISGTVDRLGERIQETLDWRSYVGEYPLVALGLAAGVGLTFSGLFKRRPSPRERIVDALAETVEDITDQVRNNFGGVLQRNPFVIGSVLKRGAGGLAATLLSTVIKNQATRMLAERRSRNSATSTSPEVESSFQSSTAGSSRS